MWLIARKASVEAQRAAALLQCRHHNRQQGHRHHRRSHAARAQADGVATCVRKNAQNTAVLSGIEPEGNGEHRGEH